MSLDVANFQKLLASIGYKGQFKERKIAEAFKGREDVLRFLGSNLSRDNLVEPEKVSRLEKLQKKDALFDPKLEEGYESENDMVEEWQGELESAERFLEPEVSITGLQDEANRESETWKLYQKKKTQLQGLERKLRKSINKSNQRFNAYYQRNTELDSQVTAAQNDAWIACNLLDEARKDYLQVLEDFKDLLVNKCENWFFPQADMMVYWKYADSMEADMKRVQAVLCSSTSESGFALPMDNRSKRPKYTVGEQRVPPMNTMSWSDALRVETKYDIQPWFSEVKMLQMNRLLLVREGLKAARRLSSVQAKLELYKEYRIHSSIDGDLSADSHNLEDELHDLMIQRKSLLEDFPKQCLRALESSLNSLLIEHLGIINGKWEVLNKNKKILQEFLNGHLTRYRAIEALSQSQSSILKSHLPHISFVHNQLQDLVSKSQLRREQFISVEGNELVTDFIPHDDVFMNMMDRAVALNDDAIALMRECFTSSDDSNGGRDKNLERLRALPNFLTPVSKLQGSWNASKTIFSPQSSYMPTPESPRDDCKTNQTTPETTTEGRGLAASLSSLCSKLTALSDLYNSVSTVTDDILVGPKDDVKTRVRMAEEIGKLYALIFSERDSRRPSLSTSTIFDTFKSAESLAHELDAERRSIEEELMRFSINLRGDSVKTEQRLMMCAFFADKEVFVGKHADRVNEANRLRSDS